MNDASTPPAPVPPCAFRSFGRPQGAAKTLVLSHSLGADSRMWEPQFAPLAAEFHVVTVDTRGHGASQVPPPPYMLPQLAADVLSVLDQLDIERFYFCGLSMGGLIGQWLGCFVGERVQRLVLCNTAARVGSDASWAARIQRVHERGMPTMAEEIVPTWVAPDFQKREPTLYQQLLHTFQETDPTGYIGCCTALQAADLRPQVAKILAPTLVIGGELDRSTPPAEAQWLHSQIPNSELTLFANAAHLSNLDRPDDFTARVLSFLVDAAG